MFFSIRPAASVLVSSVCALLAQQAAAVCAGGQMAVGTESLQYFSYGGNSYEEYSGFLMANNCNLISQNGLTQDSNQYCKGGYSNGASVTCSGNTVVAAVDTVGQSWTCHSTSDTSCNVGGSGGMFQVLACCDRD